MTELALLGEFRFVEGPEYFKSWHGENLSIKRGGWSREHWLMASACYAAWMIEVVAPVGGSAKERRRLFRITLDRFAGRDAPLKWIRSVLRTKAKAFLPDRMWDQLKNRERLRAVIQEHRGGLRSFSTEDRSFLLREIFERLKSGGRFDPHECMNISWKTLSLRYFGTTE
jgi:hypothetical protein